jgi:hypothetical protein
MHNSTDDETEAVGAALRRYVVCTSHSVNFCQAEFETRLSILQPTCSFWGTWTNKCVGDVPFYEPYLVEVCFTSFVRA